MSSVFKCKDDILERFVAVKVVKSKSLRKRMEDEVRTLLKMRSKHVVQIFDLLDLEEDGLGIVQEFVDGPDLFTHPKPSSEFDYYKILWQIAAGISDIHDLDIIHRDIKPNNMKLDSESVLKIFDFGLARESGPDAATAGFVGTPGFAAPELYAAAPTFTHAVDTYAFAASAIYLATGDIPKELKQRPPTVLSALDLTGAFPVAPDVTAILYACLGHVPASRPRMSAVRDLLAKYLLKDRHRALVVFNGRATTLDIGNRSVRLSMPAIGHIEIAYDGLQFVVKDVFGEIFINNQFLPAGRELPGACVIAFGAAHRATDRRYVTFDVSYPEVVL